MFSAFFICPFETGPSCFWHGPEKWNQQKDCCSAVLGAPHRCAGYTEFIVLNVQNKKRADGLFNPKGNIYIKRGVLLTLLYIFHQQTLVSDTVKSMAGTDVPYP